MSAQKNGSFELGGTLGYDFGLKSHQGGLFNFQPEIVSILVTNSILALEQVLLLMINLTVRCCQCLLVVNLTFL